MARTNKTAGEGTQTAKKKLPLLLRILLALLALAFVLGAVVACLGLDLLGRISRPAEDGFAAAGTPEPEDEYAPDQTPTPTRTPELTPTPHPSATPRPTLPVSEYYEQTYLTDAQLAKMAENNASDEFINVLLIGADRRSKKGSYNSDTMMIATIDKRHGTLKLTTLMRDMLVNILGHGYGKLNSAAARGGIELLFQTIEENFHIVLTQYVLVDFYMFVDVIDALGGITVQMTAEEISAANDCIAGLNKQLGVEYLWDGFIFADPGPVKLTGKQALGYSRIRKIDSEFARTERQYTVLNTVLSIFRSKSLIPCTACRYCTAGCPQHISIPDLFAVMNAKQIHRDWNADYYYDETYTKSGGRASDCIRCGKCEKVCPQHLHIRDLLADVAAEFEKKG